MPEKYPPGREKNQVTLSSPSWVEVVRPSHQQEKAPLGLQHHMPPGSLGITASVQDETHGYPRCLRKAVLLLFLTVRSRSSQTMVGAQ